MGGWMDGLLTAIKNYLFNSDNKDPVGSIHQIGDKKLSSVFFILKIIIIFPNCYKFKNCKCNIYTKNIKNLMERQSCPWAQK